MRRLKENTMGKTKEDDLPKEMREKIDKLGNKVNSLQEAATMKIDKTVDHQKAIEILEIKEEAKKILKVKEKAKVVKEKRIFRKLFRKKIIHKQEVAEKLVN